MINKNDNIRDKFFDNQDIFSIDIEDLYDNYILAIDSFKSHFNAIDSTLTESITSKKIDEIFSMTDINTPEYQESRCNAFYRMMGFPVVASDGSFYTPGFDPDLTQEDINKKISTANNIDKNLKNKILTERERFSKNKINIFRTRNIDATALAMASVYIRSFDKQIDQSIGPLDVDLQNFIIEDRNQIKNKIFFDKPISLDLSKTRHLIRPFIVDPRIELTVIPSRNRTCVPFLLNKQDTKLSITNNGYLKRPYIEKVISTRLSVKNVKLDSGDYINSILSTIKSNDKIRDQQLLSEVSNDLGGLYKSETVIFGQYVKIIRAIVDKLVQSINTIKEISNNINWQPVCNISGPEYGVELGSVVDEDKRNKNIEIDILNSQRNKILQEINFDIGLGVDADAGNFIFSGIDDIILGDIKNVGKSYEDHINELNNIRNQYGVVANQALKNIEIIMGEFSGLGLIDIVAIQCALWIMDIDSLVGLVDDKATERLGEKSKKNNTIKYTGNKKGIITSLTEFEKKITEIYKLIQNYYDAKINTSLSEKKSS